MLHMDLKKTNSTTLLKDVIRRTRPAGGMPLGNSGVAPHRHRPVRSLECWPELQPQLFPAVAGLLSQEYLRPVSGWTHPAAAVVIVPLKKKHLPVSRWVVRFWRPPIHRF